MGRIWVGQRYFCDIIDDMKKADACKNYSYMLGLIQELHVIGQAMEEAIELKTSRLDLTQKMKETRRIAKKLNKYTKELEELNNEFKKSKKK